MNTDSKPGEQTELTGNRKLQISRRERDRMRQRQEIMDAALALFSEHGYASVSMQEIAENSGYAVGTIYNLFAGKDALYQEIIRSHARQIYHELMRELDQAGPPDQKLRNMIVRHHHVFQQHAQIVRLYLSESFSPESKTRDPEVQQLWRRGLKRISEVIEAGITEGIFKPLPAATVALALSGALEIVAFTAIAQSYPVNHIASTMEQVFLYGLLQTANQTEPDHNE